MIQKYRAATEAFLADLLTAAYEGRWSKLSTDSGRLVTVPGGKSAFQTMREAMGAAGLLEELPGYYRTYKIFGQDQRKASRTCFRPTAKLLSLANGHGVPLTGARDHLAFKAPPKPTVVEVLTLVATKVGEGRPQRLPIPHDDPEAAKITSEIERLNAFLLAEGRIGGIAFAGLRRSFNNADRPDFAYQWHGRYYSMPHADHYETMEGGKETRQGLVLIDRKPAREVDISASQLTILHGLLGEPFDPSRDPYDLPALDRELVKRWLLLVLGSCGSAHGGNPLKKVKIAGLARYPFLAELPNAGIGPLDLQFHEAEIIRLAMEDLMAQGIGFLPVHDALLVAEGNEPSAERALKNAFRVYFLERLGLPLAPSPRLKFDNQVHC
jgi:hypothetical protein